ncbi:MAG: type II toxin-antitoxin system VapC family toxin [Opitutales bacterium]|nr:type II toxin-antitoxin system VapC family toxin [Opitutales bacterium]
MILDSTFLVDFERERKRRKPGAACAFLRAHADDPFCITFTIAGELGAGQSLGVDRAKWYRFIQSFRILESSPDVAWEFGQAYRHLQSQGTLIGANDLWIGATGLAYGLPVVTRNAREFGRIPGLEVLSY